MSKPDFKLVDLERPVVDLPSEQSVDIRGGLLNGGYTGTTLPAVQDGTSNTIFFGEITVTKPTDKGTGKLGTP